MSEAIQTASSAAEAAVHVARAHISAVDPAQDVIAGIKDVPAAQELMKALQSHAETVTDAVHALVQATDFENIHKTAAAHAEGGDLPDHAHLDVAKLKAATEKLKGASDLSEVTGCVQKLAADDALIAELREGFAEKGLTGGIDEVRGALKSIDVEQIGVVQQLEAIAAKAGADAPGVSHLQSELHAVNEHLKQEVSSLLGAVDSFVAKLGD